MITRIVLTDSEHGDFVYERDPTDPFSWCLSRVGEMDMTRVPLEERVKYDGRDVLWQAAIAVQQGVDT